jgi:hypothetical protein
VRPRDSSKDGRVEAESLEASAFDDASSARPDDFVDGEAGDAPLVPARFNSEVVRSMPEEPVLPVAVRGPAHHLVNPSRVSRLMSIGVTADLTPRAVGRGWASLDEEESTVVDGSGAALTQEQNTALARRIQTALDQTLPMGTPKPGPVQPTPSPPEATQERNPRWFKQTMLLGLVQPPSSTPAPSEPPSSSVLRASFVRDVGPPTSPPPRRSRRSAPPLADDAEAAAETDHGPGDHEAPDHEAFELDHPIVAPELAPWSESAVRSGSTPRRDARDVPALAARPPLILPPAPGSLDFERAPSPYAASAHRQLERSVPGVGLAASHGSARAPAVRSAPLLLDLPSADPFAGFVAPEASTTQRWGIVLVIALAVVGLFSLAAIALGLLGKTGW